MIINIKPTKFGPIIEGTLNTGDLLEAFSRELEWQFQRNGAFYALPENRDEARRINHVLEKASDLPDTADGEPGFDGDGDGEPGFLVEELQEELQNFAPAYGYFGANPGDGSAFGFWLDEDALETGFDGLMRNDLSEVPEDYQGEVIVVNDHGNRALYVADNGDLRVVWSIV